jgi:hypothetical protein
MTRNQSPLVASTQVVSSEVAPGKSENLTSQMGVQHYSEDQLLQISRLAPIKYCTLPEYYLEEAVEEYCPKSPQESKDAHSDRKKRAKSAFEPFYPYLRNLIVGTALRKGITPIDPSEKWTEFFKNVDLEGTSLNSYAKKAFTNAIDGGIAGLWVDYPSVKADLSAREERALALRPWWVVIKCEDVLELRHGIRTIDINGKPFMARLPVYLRLRASHEVKSTNSYYVANYPAVREYSLVTDPETGIVTVQWILYALLRDTDGRNKNDYEQVDSGTINKPFIPFVPAYGGEVEEYNRARPQLLDIARLNLHHWSIAADIANNIHNTCFDTMWGTGIRDDDSVDLESDRILTASAPEAKFGMMSPEMKGAEAGLQNLARIEKSMENLAAVSTTTSKPQAESGFAKVLDRAPSDSQLAVLIQSLEDSLNLLILYTSTFINNEEPVQVAISKDFIPVKMHSQQVMAMINIWEKTPLPISLLLKIFEAGMIFEGIPEFEVKALLKQMKLTGDETSQELGYSGNPAGPKVQSEPGAPAEPTEAATETRESADNAAAA